MALPPGPTSSSALQSWRWLRSPLSFLTDARERYGSVFTVKLFGFGSEMVVISDPETVKALYTEREHGIPPSRVNLLESVLGSHGLLLQEGPDHLTRRKLMLPPFHGERMRSYEPLVEKIVSDEGDSGPLEREFPIHPRMQALTLEVILRVVFGISETARLQALSVLLTQMLAEAASLQVLLFGAASKRIGSRGAHRKFVNHLREIDDLLYAEIAERRSDPSLEQRDDPFSMLMQARFEDGGQMSDEELRDQLMTLVVAGHETTGTGLAWAFDLLLSHPEQLQRLRASLGEGEDGYLNAVIAESLRLRPVIPFTARQLAKELTADGVALPAGTQVTPAIWLIHTREDLYPEPLAFRPERFLEDAPNTYAWIPFGGGIRRCIGAAFAEFEMRALLREAFTRCDLRKPGSAPEQAVRRGAVIAPKDGTPIVATARRPAPGREPAAV